MKTLLLLFFSCAAFAWQGAGPAPTPPMGWNSWDAYGTTVKEAEVKANAYYMAAHLASHGWQYIVVDIQWSDAQAKAHGYRPHAELTMDANGRLMPAVNRFPSAAGGVGFRPLADYVHAKGLKFGIHIMRGIPRRAVEANLPIAGSAVRAAAIADRKSICEWNTDMYGVDVSKPGGQDYYDSIVKLYASWGVDFIKADDMARPFHGDEIAALHRAIAKCGRTIVLSLSPGAAELSKAAFYAANSQMWRVADDFWDRWIDLKNNFDLLAAWSRYAGPDSWPDGDMLPLGRIGIRAERGDDRPTCFTRDEQRTLLTLWSIARSPLMYGGDLPSLDAATLALLTNDEVIAVLRTGAHQHELFRKGDAIAWISDADGGKARYLALFHTGDKTAAEIAVRWSELGLAGECEVRDIWARKALGRWRDGRSFTVPPHGAGLYGVGP